MAIVKHKTSKNARYADVLDYYTYKHEESQQTGHYEPILDENGLMIERDDFAVAYITAQGEEADPELWAAACMRTNLLFRKNLDEGDRKNHEYIIAHPDEDNMTVEQLLEEGRAFARENLPGYDCLIGAHDNHVHITINSVRALQRDHEEDWMMRDKTGQILPCELEAGGKHQDSPGLRLHMNDWLLEYTRQHGFVQKDNNAIAAVHRAERHGSKNDHMKAALLEAAGRSKNMADLQRIMKEDYSMDLKASSSGKTISVLYPGNEKYVRLRTLGLEPADLTRRFAGEEYTFTSEAEERQRQKEFEEAEQKKSIDWIRERRQRNNDRAERMAARSEEILAQQIRAKGDRYDKAEFQDLRYLIRETAYVSASLQTELDKLDKLLERWQQYQDPSITDKEHWSHGGYVRFCGCDPDSAEELADLKAEREIIEAQKAHADAMNEALQAEAVLWRGRNNLTYTTNSLAWAKQREKQLKMQLKQVKASRKKLWEISCNCERAALRYEQEAESYGMSRYDLINPKWDNVYKFRGKWMQAVTREEEIQQKLREIKQKKKDAKAQVKEARKRARELDLGR
jgi:hypothetical protein